MFYSLTGKPILENQKLVGLRVGPIGYRVITPNNTDLTDLVTQGSDLTLYTQVIENDQGTTIYGFESTDLRDLFNTIIDKVAGVGPKMTIGLLTHLTREELAAIVHGKATWPKIPGLGSKSMERIEMELKTILSIPTTAHVSKGQAGLDAINALVALGTPKGHAQQRIEELLRLNPKLSTQELITLGLQKK